MFELAPLLISAVILGLLGGGHCLGMCGGLMGALSPNFGGKMIDLCNQGDPICSDGNKWNAHLSYVPGMTSEAANFVVGRL